jgi:hypothetical protein
MNFSKVSLSAGPATTTPSAVSSKAISTSTFPVSRVLRSATIKTSCLIFLISLMAFTPSFFTRGVQTSKITLSLSGICLTISRVLLKEGLSKATWRYGGRHNRLFTLKPVIGCLARSLSYMILSKDG